MEVFDAIFIGVEKAIIEAVEEEFVLFRFMTERKPFNQSQYYPGPNIPPTGRNWIFELWVATGSDFHTITVSIEGGEFMVGCEQGSDDCRFVAFELADPAFIDKVIERVIYFLKLPVSRYDVEIRGSRPPSSRVQLATERGLCCQEQARSDHRRRHALG
ncbi:MAG: hypothetical protein HN975_02145 [Anaerolineae bacterium]|jgi:hypothetical protein|nr:hypothetical protein [Anaerolineae bacterium]